MTTDSTKTNYPFLSGGGEMGELTRNFDWSTTSLGTTDRWPQSLRTTVSLILNAQFPMFLWWGPELIQFYNDAYRPSMGREGGKHPAALGKPGADTWPEIWPTIKPFIDRVLTGGEPTWQENQLIPIDRNGQLEEVYWTFSYSPVLDDKGQIAGVLVICQETTGQVLAQRQLTRSETRFRRLIEQAPVAVALFRGPEFMITLANERVLEYWGRSREQVMDKPLFAALPEASSQGFEALLTGVLTTGERVVAREMTVPLKRNGRWEQTYIDFVYEPFYEANGNADADTITGVMVVCVEVTEQVLARQQTEQLLVQERELNELKSNFVTLASHEFRTPMGTILSSASLIGRYNGPAQADKRQRHVDRIQSAVYGLTGLLNDFLSLSQMEQTTLHGNAQPLNIITFCEEVMEDMQPVIKPRQRVMYTHQSGEPLVSLDGQMLKNILINLLVNASKYSADGNEIELTTAVEAHQLRLTVRDEGIGIPDADKDKLFVNFFRASNTSHVQGTGLGLYIVKRYVDLLGGTVTFESQLDSGTTFTILLPLFPLAP